MSAIAKETRDRNVTWAVMSCPAYHAMGIVMQLFCPLITGLPAGLFTPTANTSPTIPTPENTIRASRAIGCDAMRVVPAFIEVMSPFFAHADYSHALIIPGVGSI